MADDFEFNLEDELLDADFTSLTIGSAEELAAPGSKTPNTKKPAADNDFDRMLDDFINTQIESAQDSQIEEQELIKNNKPSASSLRTKDDFVHNLYNEERQLYEAYINFSNSVLAMAEQQTEFEAPFFNFEAQQLYPRFRPSRGRLLNLDVLSGWEFMLKAQPVRLASLPPKPSDEQLLSFAEKCTDENLQLAIISYVEILIEMEGCEISYNLRKAKHDKRKLERQIYLDHQARKEKIKKYIEAIQEKNFPVDAERLVNNYFKTAKKDPDGARKILENNPATYAPIQVDKIQPRFFGMIKPKPEDGIRINKELGEFFKKLKI